MLDSQMIINLLLALLAFFWGWFLRDLKKVQENNGARLHNVELLVTGNYVTKEEFNRNNAAMFVKLDKIYDGVTECKINGNTHHRENGVAGSIGKG